MKAKKIPCPATGCDEKPKGVLRLRLHLRDAHPESADLYRALVKKLDAEEKAALAAERNDPDKLWAKLKHLYANCPCGKDLEWHRKGFDAVHRRSA